MPTEKNTGEQPSPRAERGGDTRVLVAAIQMTSGPDVGENLEVATGLLEEARRRGVRVAGLPENFSFMGSEAEKLEVAEEVGGRTISAIREMARSLKMAVLAGTIPERVADEPQKTANTSVLIDENGDIAAIYRKIHLFDVELDEAQSFRESSYIVAGKEVVTGRAAGILHGLSVCYDLRFPELYRSLDLAGAELVWAPAAFTLATGKDHWEILLRARAIENGAFVAAPAQFGKHTPRRITYGNAMIVDPWGKVLARAPDVANTMAVAEVRTDYREEIRKTIPTWRHHVL